MDLETCQRIFVHRRNLFQEIIKQGREAINVVYRAFFDYTNFPEERDVVKKYFLNDCAEQKLQAKDIYSFVAKIVNENEYEGEIEKPQYTWEIGGVLSVTWTDPEGKKFEFRVRNYNGSHEKAIALWFLEHSLPTHIGLFWSFSRQFLEPFLEKEKCTVEAFSLGTQQSILPNKMSLWTKMDSNPANIGNFFTDSLPSASYYVNPPYTEFTLKKAMEKMRTCLKSKKKYTFVFITPTWEDAEFYNLAMFNKNLKYFHRYDKAPIWSNGKVFTANVGFTIFVFKN